MIRPIVKDIFLLGRKAEKIGKEDAFVLQDLKDTLYFYRRICTGMAANMIGCNKAAIIACHEGKTVLMLNPEIVKKSEPYETAEGCLSLQGERKTLRYQKIEVRYQDEKWKWHQEKFHGRLAQIIQHECDHLQGILI